ncbi:MAG: Crp/Fnr family transcriptional regulator [Calothrix sp. MO_192.B10]|nr:Crp/Fnr family transcriptional regulator [Calothrix sp. MO_192.B10]
MIPNTLLPPLVPSGKLRQQLFIRREIMPLYDDVLWRIERGAVRTQTWNEDGSPITLGYWGVGDLIGYPLSKIKPYQIECLTDIKVTVLPPDIWHKNINGFLNHIQQSEELLNIIHRQPVSLRLWKFLLWLSDKFGITVEKGKLIELCVTHQEIAEVLNTTRVTVTRLLKEFEQQGKIIRHKRSIILCLPN